MKNFVIFILIAIMGFSLAACGTAKTDTKEVNILTWENYIPKEVLDAFSAETGIKVNFSSANDNESMFSKIQTAKGGEYDIVILSDYTVKMMIDENLVKELDKDKLTNFKNLDPAYLNQYYDMENKYAIPYSVSSALLVYDYDVIGRKLTGYEDLWAPEFEDSIVLLDGDRDIIGLALQSLGYSVNETDPSKLEEAKNKLLTLKPNVIGFDANTPHNMLISGEASIGYMFGSQATEAMKAKESITFAFPKEGMGRYTDCVIMTKNAPNEESAYTFLNYILDGKNSAAISNIINYTNCNLAAKEFLSDEFLNNPVVNIPSDVMKQAQSYENVGDAVKIYSEIWAAFKNE